VVRAAARRPMWARAGSRGKERPAFSPERAGAKAARQELRKARSREVLFREERTSTNPPQGRSSDFRIARTRRAFPPSAHRSLWFTAARTNSAVALCGGRPRLQRRDRNGFAPFSLFFPASDKRPEHLEAEPILSRLWRLSTAADRREKQPRIERIERIGRKDRGLRGCRGWKALSSVYIREIRG
jgi:hypothetical protein